MFSDWKYLDVREIGVNQETVGYLLVCKCTVVQVCLGVKGGRDQTSLKFFSRNHHFLWQQVSQNTVSAFEKRLLEGLSC